MKAGVVTFPGSNCDEDCSFALGQEGFEVRRLWHKDVPNLSEYSLIALPGGFSYGDYLRCGAMAAQSPILQSVKEFAQKGGLVIGICNGFQILCEAGLLPGALAKNEGLRFICKDVTLKIEKTDNPWTSGAKAGDRWRLPIAHGDGRYVVEEAQYRMLSEKGQVLLSYCSETGALDKASNPNGSVYSIAGICNEKKNVFGLMPHPERATDLRSRDGKKLWSSVRTHLGSSR